MTKAQKIEFIQQLIVALDLKYNPLGQGGVDESAVNALIEQYNTDNPSSGGGVIINTYIDNPPGLSTTQVQSLIDTAIASRISENNSPQQITQQVYTYNQDVPPYTGLYEFADTNTLIFPSDATNDRYYKYIDDLAIVNNKLFIIGGAYYSIQMVISLDIDPVTKTLSNLQQVTDIPRFNGNNRDISSIASTPNGTRILVYVPWSIKMYDLVGGTWTYICEISTNMNVKTLSMNATGSIAMFTESTNKIVREYRLSAYGAWELYTDNVIDFRQFYALTISADGLRAIGVDNTTKSIVEYTRDNLDSAWVQTIKTYTNISNLNLILKVTLSVTNNKLLCAYKGGVLIFLRQDDGEWLFAGSITSQDADTSKQFGRVVAMSTDGNTVVCKNSNTGNTESTTGINRVIVYKNIDGTVPVIPANQVIEVTEGDYSDDGLTHKYELSSNSLDSIGTADGVWVGSEIYTNGVASFSAGDDGILVNESIINTDEFAICMKVNDYLGSHTMPLYCVDASGNNHMFLYYINGYIKYRAGDTTEYNYVEDTPIPDGEHSVVLQYDGTNVQLYINGVLAKQDAFSQAGVTYIEFKLGYGYDNYYRFEGTIRDVKVYNRALTEQEIGGYNG